jgi:hypothetical protein
MPSDSEPSAMAQAYRWAYRIMLVSLEMVVPGVAGVLVDRFLGTLVVFTLAGFALGFTAAGFHMAAMLRPPHGRESSATKTDSNANTEETED